MNYQRSLAAYDWARAAGHLGDFAGAEQAFLYSLRLEEIRNESDKHLPMRHYELARLYHAWGKSDLSIQHYRQALAATDKGIKDTDPIGFAGVLTDFSICLGEAGQTNEAVQLKKEADELCKNNPGIKAKFRPEPYPKPNGP